MLRIKGFTLLEITICIIILGVLATIALPNYIFVKEKASLSEGINILESLLKVQRIHHYETGSWTNQIGDLDVVIAPSEFYLPPTVHIPVAATDPVASIVHSASGGGVIADRDYRLNIDQDSHITCIDNGSSFDCCRRLGY